MIDVLGALIATGIDAHSSVVLTYSIDFLLYDGLVRRRLRQAGAVNQLVFCDFRKYQEQLGTLGTTRRFGRSYSVTPVHQKAAFHPKLYLVLGRKGGRLLIGSGNATIGGLLRNAETVGLFEYDREEESGPHPAFRECFEFIEEVSREAPEVVRKQLARARSWSPWLEANPVSDHRTVLFGAPGRRPLLQQIAAAIGERTVREVLVCTASVDRRLVALSQLAAMAKQGRVRCVVQPDQIRIDGEAVKLAGRAVEWLSFVDPYPKTKKRRDAFAHAKLFVFDCGGEEIFAYGSANASSPALLESGGNTEIIVLFDPWKRGTAIARLGLEPSLKGGDIAKELMNRVWAEEPDPDDSEGYAVLLTAAVPSADGVSLRVAGPPLPAGAELELYEAPSRSPVLKAKVSMRSGEPFVRLRGIPEGIRVARLVRSGGEPLSNLVGITWPEVATARSSSGIHARTEAAIGAMYDGLVLGTVLFELLDQVRDFEIVRGRGPGGTKKASEQNKGREEEVRSVESFYTDKVPGEATDTGWVGDRTDLDLLAALVQPLQSGPAEGRKSSAADEDADDLDDSVLGEEEERRGIDEKGGSATGEERTEARPLTSTEALVRASKRLLKRLDRAALAVESALAHRRQLVSVPATGLARQIWMAHIAAFLAGREAPTSDGDGVLCLEPLDFARYALRVCRALAGGKDGGLLELVPEESFSGPDRDSLKRGLSFLWTCAIFAVAETVDYWLQSPVDVDDEETEYADDVWDTVPELIAARFVLAIRHHCRKPDVQSIEIRLPAWNSREDGWFDAWKRRIDRLAKLIEKCEGSGPTRSKSPRPLVCGTLVHHPSTGVTVLMRQTEGRKCHLLDLSQSDAEHPEKMSRIFLPDQIVPVVMERELDGWVWREPHWQVERN